jgi:hypothetical protein
MDKKQLKQEFNTQLINYLGQLSLMFPKEKDIKTYIFYLKTINTLTPNSIYKFFNTNVSPLRQYCENRDANFFLNLDYDESVGGNKESMMSAINFKNLWKVMDSESQKNTWKQFDILFLLLDKILE